MKRTLRVVPIHVSLPRVLHLSYSSLTSPQELIGNLHLWRGGWRIWVLHSRGLEGIHIDSFSQEWVCDFGLHSLEVDHDWEQVHNCKASESTNIPQDRTNLRIEKREQHWDHYDCDVENDLFSASDIAFAPEEQ